MVVQADGLGTDLQQLILAMLTSRLFRANHQSRVLISLTSVEGERSGLLSGSVVMTDNLATVEESAIIRRIGSLQMERVDTALRHSLGL